MNRPVCKYAQPQVLTWHDGEPIRVKLDIRLKGLLHNELIAIMNLNNGLIGAAYTELRRLSHYTLREWPVCTVSGQHIELYLRIVRGDPTLATGEFQCGHCGPEQFVPISSITSEGGLTWEPVE